MYIYIYIYICIHIHIIHVMIGIHMFTICMRVYIYIYICMCVALPGARLLTGHPRASQARAAYILWKSDSIHHHLLEVTCETANVLELKQKLLYTTPSGWWWCIESVFRILAMAYDGETSQALVWYRAPCKIHVYVYVCMYVCM